MMNDMFGIKEIHMGFVFCEGLHIVCEGLHPSHSDFALSGLGIAPTGRNMDVVADRPSQKEMMHKCKLHPSHSDFALSGLGLVVHAIGNGLCPLQHEDTLSGLGSGAPKGRNMRKMGAAHRDATGMMSIAPTGRNLSGVAARPSHKNTITQKDHRLNSKAA